MCSLLSIQVPLAFVLSLGWLVQDSWSVGIKFASKLLVEYLILCAVGSQQCAQSPDLRIHKRNKNMTRNPRMPTLIILWKFSKLGFREFLFKISTVLSLNFSGLDCYARLPSDALVLKITYYMKICGEPCGGLIIRKTPFEIVIWWWRSSVVLLLLRLSTPPPLIIEGGGAKFNQPGLFPNGENLID